MFSRVDADAEWILHAEGQLSSTTVEPAADLLDLAAGGRSTSRYHGALRPAGGGRLRVWPGVQRVDCNVASRRRAVRRSHSAADSRGHKRIRRAPGRVGRVIACVARGPRWRGSGSPVLVAGRFAACGRGAVGPCPGCGPVGSSAVSVELADGLGLPVLSVASMVARPVSQQQLMAALSGASAGQLFEVIWSPTKTATVTGAEAFSDEVFKSFVNEQDPLTETYQRAHEALAVVQSRLTDQDARILVVSTRGAMALPGEDVTDLGALRCGDWCAPCRPSTRAGSYWWIPMYLWTMRAVARALAAGEPQVLVRGGTVHTARVHGSRAVDSVLVPPSDGPWRLGLSSAGTFENLQLEPVPNANAPLGPGQVRVDCCGHRHQLPRRHDHPGHVTMMR